MLSLFAGLRSSYECDDHGTRMDSLVCPSWSGSSKQPTGSDSHSLDRVGLRHDGLFSRQRERPGIETRFGYTDSENSRWGDVSGRCDHAGTRSLSDPSLTRADG